MKNKKTLYIILILIIIAGITYSFTTKNKSFIQNEKDVKEDIVIKEKTKINSDLEKITLGTNLSGVLKIERTFDYRESYNTLAKLTFTPSNSKNSLLVSVMPPGVSGLENIIILNNKIYFIAVDEKPNLKYFDITDNKFGVVNEDIGKDGYISSFVSINNEIYYIAGSKEFEYCLDLPKDECLNANLYKYNFDKNKIELLAENIKGSNVLGIDKTGNLYFSLAWGDAGAWFATVYKYKDGQVEVYKKYTDVSQIEEYEEFILSLNKMRGYQSILLENGRLSPGPDISEYSKSKYFFVD